MYICLHASYIQNDIYIYTYIYIDIYLIYLYIYIYIYIYIKIYLFVYLQVLQLYVIPGERLVLVLLMFYVNSSYFSAKKDNGNNTLAVATIE